MSKTYYAIVRNLESDNRELVGAFLNSGDKQAYYQAAECQMMRAGSGSEIVECTRDVYDWVRHSAEEDKIALKMENMVLDLDDDMNTTLVPDV